MKADISSLQNKRIKDIVRLSSHSSMRRESGLFVVEGLREVTRSMEAGYDMDSIYFCPSIIGESNAEWKNILRLAGDHVPVLSVTPEVYGKIACRGGTEGVVALACCKPPLDLDSIPLKENPLVVVMESVEKPGNLGAMLRTAEACGADAVIVCDPLTDLYNPNLIRSSLGGIFVLNVAACTSDEAISWLRSKGIRILTAQLQDSELYYKTDMKCGVAIVLGSEADGLTEQWRAVSDAKIRIPMSGRIDSLNVSVSMAILCYEALRQRNSCIASIHK